LNRWDTIEKAWFGALPDGRDVYAYTLFDQNGQSVVMSEYGCSIQKLLIRDREGKLRDVALGYDTLEEYIGICAKYGKTAVLELKNHLERSDIEAIIAIIREAGWLEQTIFISFDLPNMITVRELLPGQKAQYLTEAADPAELVDTLTKYHLDLDIYYRSLTEELSSLCHAHGIEINVWTVDTPEDAQRMISLGVDYLTSNILE